ncbi:MAG: metallophosphoesterase [Parachlamydiaceae bacterium]|nr:metallophosphoesterase [Parachlamydiaceae bacterium]
MSIWALADLHLSFGIPDKKMDVFGDSWKDHPEKIRSHWLKNITADDLVLIPGDISWAMTAEEAKVDLEWIDALPGTKVMLKGNHDFWWSSLSKVEKILPPSIHVIQNNVFRWNNVAIAGTRLWDTPEYSFQQFINFVNNPRANKLIAVENDQGEMEKIFLRELARLELSLKCLPRDASMRIAMTHYPPIGANLTPSRVSALLEKYKISFCAFGHLHNVKQELPMFGIKNGVRYTLVSCDYVNFEPIKIG